VLAVDLSALAQSSDKAQVSQVVPSGNHTWQFWEWKKQLFLDDLPISILFQNDDLPIPG